MATTLTDSQNTLRRPARGGGGATPFSAIGERHREAEAASETMREQIEALEAFIVSVPCVVERRRLRYRDMLPPPDEVLGLAPGDGPYLRDRRMSRRQRREVRFQRLGQLGMCALLLASVLGIIALVFYLMTVRGA